MDQLTRDCIAAQKAGMSYGRWKALHYVPPVEVEMPKQEVEPEVKPEPEVKKEAPKRVCIRCGKEFIGGHGNRKYCGSVCKQEADMVRQNEWQKAKYWRKRGTPKRVCKHCGKEFTEGNYNTLYCGRACRYEAEKARAKAKYHRNKERMMADGKI